jgi:D-psicose/D-tagatose/L-ribulose 3-epimerase
VRPRGRELGRARLRLHRDPAAEPLRLPGRVHARALEEHGLGATASLGLTAETDISSEDPDAVARGEDLLMTAVSVVRDLGATHFCGVIHSR